MRNRKYMIGIILVCMSTLSACSAIEQFLPTATAVPPTKTPKPIFTPTPLPGYSGYMNSLIFFNTYYGDEVEVLMSNMTFKEALPISEPGDGYWGIGVFLAGSGSRLAFVNYNRTSEEMSVWVREFESGKLWEVLAAGATYSTPDNFDLSPDGKFLLYTDAQPDGSERDIYRLEVDTGYIVNLTDGHKWDNSPDWSPDGERIAFVSDRLTDGISFDEIYVMDKDGGSITRLTNNGFWEDTSPAWSPDGEKIAFVRWSLNEEEIPSGGPAGLWVINADGSDEQLITDTLVNNIQTLAWSPDGQYIAYVDGVMGRNGNLFVVKSDGSRNPEQIGTLPGEYSNPQWSLDSQALLFTIKDEYNSIYFAMKNGDLLSLVLEGATNGVWLNPEWIK